MHILEYDLVANHFFIYYNHRTDNIMNIPDMVNQFSLTGKDLVAVFAPIVALGGFSFSELTSLAYKKSVIVYLYIIFTVFHIAHVYHPIFLEVILLKAMQYEVIILFYLTIQRFDCLLHPANTVRFHMGEDACSTLQRITV